MSAGGASSATPSAIGLVADDFTGAADSAGVFARHGWSVRLSVGAMDVGAAGVQRPRTVLAVSTNSRSLGATEAADATAAAVRRLMAAGVQRLFLKIDSTMRGPVSAQVRGAIDAWSLRHPDAPAVVAPSFPAQGRTVVDGVVLVDGIAVSRTASGRDPFTPVASSMLTDLLPGYERLPASGGSEGLPAWSFADASTDAHLDAIAQMIDGRPAAVAVGSAGLASALARRWRHPATSVVRPASRGDIVVAATSLHPVTARQLGELAASAPRGVEVVTPPSERGRSAAAVADEIARSVSALVRTRPVDSLIVVGGDGAAAVLADLGATGVDIDDVLGAGCPTGIVVGGDAHGLRIVSKSGGFGSPNTLIDLVSRLRCTPRGSDSPALSTHLKEDHHD